MNGQDLSQLLLCGLPVSVPSCPRPSIHTRDERLILLLRFSSISRKMKDQNTFTLRGWRDGSVGKAFATQTFKLKFEPQHPQKKPAVAMLACNSSVWEGRNKREGPWGSQGHQSSSRVSERSNTKVENNFGRYSTSGLPHTLRVHLTHLHIHT